MNAVTPKVPLGLAHTPLRDQIREEIRQRIIDGDLQPGARIVERELAAELSVSRVPVREALRMLQTEGFLTEVPRRGVVVAQLTRQDVIELFDVREALEVLATRRATELATPEDLASLAALLDDLDTAIAADDPRTIGRDNEAFHDAIIAMTHNELLASMLEPLQGRLHWLFRQNQNAAQLQQEHRELYAAIASGDPEHAAAQALTHVRVNRQIAMRLLFDGPGEEALGSSA